MKTWIQSRLWLLTLMTGMMGMGSGLATAQTFSVLQTFNGTNGAAPWSGLVLSGNTLYGTTWEGGTSSNGTIFRVNTDGSHFTNLYNFSGSDGAQPYSGLIWDNNALLGTTDEGGSNNRGTVFSLGQTLSTICNLNGTNVGWAVRPDYGLVSGLTVSGNTLYGTVGITGYSVPGIQPRAQGITRILYNRFVPVDYGEVFTLNSDGNGYTNLYTFTNGTDGSDPESGVVISGNILYGTARAGGLGYGTVFAIKTDGTGFTNLYDFTNGTDGSNPEGSLLLVGDVLYGICANSSSSLGTIFAIHTDGKGFTNIFNLPGGTSAADPVAGLIVSGNTLYGTSQGGGEADWGTVFAVNTDGSGYTTLYSFTNGADGGAPGSVLLLAGNTLYGTATSGGTNNHGTVFSISLGQGGGGGGGGTTTTNYNITVSATPDAGGTVGGGGTFQAGTSCTVSATPNANYTFLDWTENGTVASAEAYYTFILAGDQTLAANFLPVQYTISVSAAPGADGTVGGGGTYDAGSNCTVTAVANSSYAFAGWMENGSVVSLSPDYTFTVTGDAALVANFVGGLTDKTNFTVTAKASPTAGGTVSGAGKYIDGSVCTVTATAKSGYLFNNWTVGGTVVSGSPSYAFTVTGNTALTANFTQTKYTVIVSASPGGSGTASGGGNFAANSTCKVTAKALTGYVFVDWTENGNVVSSATTYSFKLTGNRSLVANFAVKPVNYKVAVSASPGSEGTAAGGGTFTGGSSCTVTATPKSGYIFVSWTLNGNVVSGSASYTFTVTANVKLVANFKGSGVGGAGVTGTWTGSYSVPYDDFGDATVFNTTWKLHQTGSNVSGTYDSVETDDGSETKGQLNGGSVSGSTFIIYDDGGLEYVGTISGTTISGSVNTGSNFPGSFTVNKQ